MAEIVQSLTLRVSLRIIQTHATQFDGPFFRFLSRDPRCDLTVYYTRDDGARVSVDTELARRETWDHDVTSGYRSQVSSSQGYVGNGKNLINGKWHYRSTEDNLWDAASYLRSQHHGQRSRLS